MLALSDKDFDWKENPSTSKLYMAWNCNNTYTNHLVFKKKSLDLLTLLGITLVGARLPRRTRYQSFLDPLSLHEPTSINWKGEKARPSVAPT
jgi:hypothetical protein